MQIPWLGIVDALLAKEVERGGRCRSLRSIHGTTRSWDPECRLVSMRLCGHIEPSLCRWGFKFTLSKTKRKTFCAAETHS